MSFERGIGYKDDDADNRAPHMLDPQVAEANLAKDLAERMGRASYFPGCYVRVLKLEGELSLRVVAMAIQMFDPELRIRVELTPHGGSFVMYLRG